MLKIKFFLVNKLKQTTTSTYSDVTGGFLIFSHKLAGLSSDHQQGTEKLQMIKCPKLFLP